eukprot:scaffold80143_cov66-Phaeocystis_antarctica.AAC.1
MRGRDPSATLFRYSAPSAAPSAVLAVPVAVLHSAGQRDAPRSGHTRHRHYIDFYTGVILRSGTSLPGKI